MFFLSHFFSFSKYLCDSRQVELAETETELLMSLNSPYILKCYGSRRNNTTIQIELEYAQNGSLGTAITVLAHLCFHSNCRFSDVDERFI